MAMLNYATRELICKIVYYGPGYGGKTTNLQQIHAMLPSGRRGEMTSLATSEDRTLFFDLLPVNIGQIGDFNVKVQLYTVPGQVIYNATRKVVLNGVDGVVLVLDSDPEREAANYMSLANLEENLSEQGFTLDQMPLVLQYNKRDLDDAMSVEFMNASLNPEGKYPEFEAIATERVGVQESMTRVCSLVFSRLESEFTGRDNSASAFRHRMRRVSRPKLRPGREDARRRRQRIEEREMPAPEAREEAEPVRIRQFSDLRLAGMKWGHAIVDLAPDGEDGRSLALRAAVETQPWLGGTRRRLGRYARGEQDTLGLGESAVYLSRSSSDLKDSRLVRVRSDGETPDRLYLDWESPLGRFRVLPEGETQFPE